MPNPKKIEVVDAFKKLVEDSEITVATKYIGINAEQATTLRERLREAQVEFKVFKNTLVKRALDDLELSDAVPFMDGPTAWAFCSDPVVPAKTLKEFGKEVPFVEMTGAILDGQILDKAELDSLAALPSRDALVAQVVGTIAAPLRNLVGVLSAPARDLANVLEQIRKQQEEAQAA